MITLRLRKQGYSREARSSVTNRDIWGHLPAMLARNASVGSRRAENMGCDSVEQIGPGTKYVDGKGLPPNPYARTKMRIYGASTVNWEANLIGISASATASTAGS